MLRIFKTFIRDQTGVTLVEYGVALILAVGVGAALLNGLAVEVNTQMGEAQAPMQ